MTQYEYKVVPAPAKGLKAEGIKTPEARFANALEQLMNEMGGHGWEYMRADTLPSTERSGLTGSTTEWRNMLIFRRAVPQADSDATALPETPVQVATSVAAPVDTDADVDPDEQKTPRAGATHMLSDNGVEETSEVSGMSSSLQNLASNRSRLKGVTRSDK